MTVSLYFCHRWHWQSLISSSIHSCWCTMFVCIANLWANKLAKFQCDFRSFSPFFLHCRALRQSTRDPMMRVLFLPSLIVCITAPIHPRFPSPKLHLMGPNPSAEITKGRILSFRVIERRDSTASPIFVPLQWLLHHFILHSMKRQTCCKIRSPRFSLFLVLRLFCFVFSVCFVAFASSEPPLSQQHWCAFLTASVSCSCSERADRAGKAEIQTCFPLSECLISLLFHLGHRHHTRNDDDDVCVIIMCFTMTVWASHCLLIW